MSMNNLPNMLDHPDLPNLSDLQVLFSIQKFIKIVVSVRSYLPTYSEVKKPKLVD